MPPLRHRPGSIADMADSRPDPLAGVGPLPDGTSRTDGEPAHDGARADRRRALARLVAIVAVVALAAVFVAQNLHPVTVHLWITQRRLGLVWVIAGCLVAGVAVGYWVGWQGHRQALERRAERAARGGRRRHRS